MVLAWTHDLWHDATSMKRSGCSLRVIKTLLEAKGFKVSLAKLCLEFKDWQHDHSHLPKSLRVHSAAAKKRSPVPVSVRSIRSTSSESSGESYIELSKTPPRTVVSNVSRTPYANPLGRTTLTSEAPTGADVSSASSVLPGKSVIQSPGSMDVIVRRHAAIAAEAVFELLTAKPIPLQTLYRQYHCNHTQEAISSVKCSRCGLRQSHAIASALRNPSTDRDNYLDRLVALFNTLDQEQVDDYGNGPWHYLAASDPELFAHIVVESQEDKPSILALLNNFGHSAFHIAVAISRQPLRMFLDRSNLPRLQRKGWKIFDLLGIRDFHGTNIWQVHSRINHTACIQDGDLWSLVDHPFEEGNLFDETLVALSLLNRDVTCTTFLENVRTSLEIHASEGRGTLLGLQDMSDYLNCVISTPISEKLRDHKSFSDKVLLTARRIIRNYFEDVAPSCGSSDPAWCAIIRSVTGIHYDLVIKAFLGNMVHFNFAHYLADPKAFDDEINERLENSDFKCLMKSLWALRDEYSTIMPFVMNQYGGGRTPLHRLVSRARSPGRFDRNSEKDLCKRIEDFVKAGADIRLFSHDGHNALHIACGYNADSGVIRTLLQLGAHPNIRTKHGESPLQLIEKRRRYGSECISVLEEYGAVEEPTEDEQWSTWCFPCRQVQKKCMHAVP